MAAGRPGRVYRKRGDFLRVLGIDSATLVAGMAVVEGERVIVEGFLQTRKTHSERLLPLIDFWLREAELSLSDLDGVAVTLGPGSFTGLRIGLATAKGLALGAGKPLVGIPTLDALALNLTGVPGFICPILDARKSEVYTAVYVSPEPGRLIRLTRYMAVSPVWLLDWLRQGIEPILEPGIEVIPGFKPEKTNPEQSGEQLVPDRSAPVNFLGDAVPVYGELIRESLGHRAKCPLAPHAGLRASQVAFLGQEALSQGQITDYRLLRPIYIRASEAELKWKEGRPR